MKNGMYLTEADSVSFDAWFNEAYTHIHEKQCFGNSVCKNITLVVTEDCNFRCTYCYMHGKKSKSMSKQTAKDIVDFILDDERTNGYINSEESKAIILDFIGGEPLLEIDLIHDFMDYFVFRTGELDHPWSDNYVISMSSNGSLYTSEKVQKLVDKFRGRIHIGITIDGNKKLHDACRIYDDGRGTYDDVIKGVEKRLANGEHPSTKITLAPENIDYLYESVMHLFGIGYKFLNCNVVFEDVWSIEDGKRLYLQLKALADSIIDNELYKSKYISLFSESIGGSVPPENNENWCGGDGKMLAIGTDGKCYPCLRYMEYSFSNKEREPMIIGNIYGGILSQNESKHLRCLSCITRRSQSTDECFNCPISEGCAWCSAYNYDCFGTADKRTTFHCDMHKARVLANVYYWNKLYHKLSINKIFELNVPDEWAVDIIGKEELMHLKRLAKLEKEDAL